MKLYIHYDGEWKGFEGPEKPCTCHPMCKYPFQECGNCRQRSGIGEDEYNQAMTESAKNSLKILNPEVIFHKQLGKIVPGRYYEWPGTYEKSFVFYEGIFGYYLTPPAALEEESPPVWYTTNEMYQWLRRHDYSDNIAKELSEAYANNLQGAFNKGYEKGVQYGKEITRKQQTK